MGDMSIEEARAKMIAKRFGGNKNGASTGGSGTARRKVKAAHKSSGGDEKKLGGALKKLGLQSIPGIEEVNLFKDDGDVIHFGSPKVQANVQSHIFVVSGQADCKPIQSYLPGILSQLGPEGLAQLRKVAAQYENANGGAAEDDDDDDDIPDLVENFEEASEKN